MDKERSSRYYSITAGPCRDLLFDAMKYLFDKAAKLPVKFTVVYTYKKDVGATEDKMYELLVENVRITSIQHEDGSGESFNLQGSCDVDLDPFTKKPCPEPHRFKAYYNSRTRKGSIVFF